MAKKNNILEVSDMAYERAFLAGLAQFGLDAYADVDFVDSSCFTDQTNSILFECIKSSIIDGSTTDLSVILSKANSMGFANLFQTENEISYIRSLFNFPVHKTNMEVYAARLTKLKIIRDAHKILTSCANKIKESTGEESINDLLRYIEEPISKLTSSIYNTGNLKPVSLGEDVVDYVYDLIENPRQHMGLSTGIPAYDEAIGGGLRRGAVDIVAARPKMGKSTTGLHVAVHQDKNNVPTLIVDTEMNKDGQTNRVLANISEIDVNHITAGDMNSLEKSKLIETAQKFKESKIYHINVSGQPFETILSIIRQWIYKHVGFDENGKTKDCVIVYDYLKLTSGEGINDSMKEYQILGFQITSLYNFCIKYDVPCLAFVQLNQEMNLSQSDRILWLCTSFTKFLEKSAEEQAEDVTMGITVPYNRKLQTVVSRWGPGMEQGDYINLRMIGKYSKITVGPTRNELLKGSNAGIQTDQIPDIAQAGTDTGDSEPPWN